MLLIDISYFSLVFSIWLIRRLFCCESMRILSCFNQIKEIKASSQLIYLLSLIRSSIIIGICILICVISISVIIIVITQIVSCILAHRLRVFIWLLIRLVWIWQAIIWSLIWKKLIFLARIFKLSYFKCLLY